MESPLQFPAIPLAIPYAGSFQRGLVFRQGTPLEAVWRRIERIGTIDNLTRVAAAKGHPPSVARVAALRIRQAVEFRRLAREATPVTKPLLLYYSVLNLARGALLVMFGSIGGASHGLKYSAGPTLLQCTATPTKSGGTFGLFAHTFGVQPELLSDVKYNLRDIFAVIPESYGDFPLLGSGNGSVVKVRVSAMIRGATTLTFECPGVTGEVFAAEWERLFPWMAGKLEFAGVPFALRIKEAPVDEEAIAQFCKIHLLHDLRLRDDAVWYDHIVGNGVALLPRHVAYLAALFILSNVSRYEPEFLDDATNAPTDLAYFLSSFLDNAERFVPQLVLESLHAQPMFFE